MISGEWKSAHIDDCVYMNAKMSKYLYNLWVCIHAYMHYYMGVK